MSALRKCEFSASSVKSSKHINTEHLKFKNRKKLALNIGEIPLHD